VPTRLGSAVRQSSAIARQIEAIKTGSAFVGALAAVAIGVVGLIETAHRHQFGRVVFTITIALAAVGLALFFLSRGLRARARGFLHEALDAAYALAADPGIADHRSAITDATIRLDRASRLASNGALRDAEEDIEEALDQLEAATAADEPDRTSPAAADEKAAQATRFGDKARSLLRKAGLTGLAAAASIGTGVASGALEGAGRAIEDHAANAVLVQQTPAANLPAASSQTLPSAPAVDCTAAVAEVAKLGAEQPVVVRLYLQHKPGLPRLVSSTVQATCGGNFRYLFVPEQAGGK